MAGKKLVERTLVYNSGCRESTVWFMRKGWVDAILGALEELEKGSNTYVDSIILKVKEKDKDFKMI